MFWRLEFYRVDCDGFRVGGDAIDHPSESIDLAADEARAVMTSVSFPWGKPNYCLVTSEDGAEVREVRTTE